MKHPIAQTRNGLAVYVDLIHSQAAANIARQPHLLSLLKEALAKTTAKGPEMRIERDMGRTIGYNVVVETSDKDTILYARLMHDTTFARFVKNGKPGPTQYLTMILQRDEDGVYALHDCWMGRVNPPRPGSPRENDESRPYWETHAFVLDQQAIQLRTATKTCPY